MKSGLSRLRRGYTLIELAVAISCGLITAAMLLALVNQQFAFLKIYHAQNFLIREAPLISTHMNRLIGQAERFRLHNSTADAMSGTNPVMTGASVLVLNFQQPDGTTQAAMLSFEDHALYYYLVPTAGALSTPQWAITREASNVSFAIVDGVLRVTLTGPNSEQITYSGVMQQ